MTNVPGDNKRFVEVSCSSAREFFDYLDPNHDMWAGTVDNTWIFRGQNDAKWDLTPSAWRKTGCEVLRPLFEKYEKFVDEIVDMFFSSGEHTPEMYPGAREFSIQVLAEHEAEMTFAKLADRLGHPVPELPTAPMFSAGCGVVPKYIGPHPRTALAQHHGIPTRLLDWTRNARVAAFFAANIPSDSQCRPNHIAVWAIDLAIPADLHNCAVREFTVQRYQFEFLHAQDGLFLYSDPRSRVMKGGNWPSLDGIIDEHSASEDVVEEFRDTPDRYKLTLASEHADDLLRLLWRENISMAHLMPSYDNVAASTIRRWRWG